MVEHRPRRALRPPLAARIARIAVPAALVGVVTTGVIVASTPAQTQLAYPATAVSLAPAYAVSSATADRHRANSRAASGDRPAATSTAAPNTAPTAKPTSASKARAKAAPTAKPPAKPTAAPPVKVVATRYATSDLNIRVEPSQKSDVVTVTKAGSKVSVTATVRGGFRFVSFRGKGRWVTDRYLSDRKPAVAATGFSFKPCTSGSKVESGLTPDAIKVHRAICARYPQVTAFGGTRGGGGFHATGQAVDNMISDSKVGWEIARWVRANAKRLGVSEVIYSQHIWTVQRGGEGWRSMSDRGSRTANHYDHVHVSVYGHRATG